MPCGRYCDSRKRVQTHFADLVNNPCRVDARLARNGFEPTAGFLFPLRQVQGSRPSRPPPLAATWEPPGTCAAPPRGDGQDRGARSLPPRLLPAPLPSSLLLLLFLLVSAPEKKKKKIAPAALQLSPKGEGETTQEATPSPRAPRPGRGRGNQRQPQVVSLFFSSTWPCLGAAPRPGQARPRVLLQGPHPRSLQLPSSARG